MMVPMLLLVLLKPPLAKSYFPTVAYTAHRFRLSKRSNPWPKSSNRSILAAAKDYAAIHTISNDEGHTDSGSTVPVADMSFQEWTFEHDQLLWKHQATESVSQLAARLGRGLRGTEERLQRLQSVESAAYQRLFAGQNMESGKSSMNIPSLVPAAQIMCRIEWDPALDASEFFIRYYDRVQDTLMDCPFLAPNTSIESSQRKLIDALPEHRIMAILYRDYVVWDRESRLDLVSSGNHMTSIQEGYDSWKEEADAKAAQQVERKKAVLGMLQDALGDEDYNLFKELTKDLTDSLLAATGSKKKKAQVSPKVRIENFVEQALGIFRKEAYPDLGDALDALSEASALHPEASIRPLMLDEIHLQLSSVTPSRKKETSKQAGALPDVDEDDLVETFVRGTGPGGQKINKTSNRVVLVHTPTQVRVECQDTRSLPQNRKIARKRLRIKLDAYYNGNESRTQRVAQKAASKKQKAKARSRARLRKKQLEKEERSKGSGDED